MTGVRLTVHRGTQQIGGTCIEIVHPDGDRLVLDAGRPLDAPEGATGLLPASLDRTRPATVLISHPHQDHWGLVEELPPTWPIWTGSKSAKLIAITSDITRRPLARTFKTWTSRSGPFAIGPFTVTPYFTDHSAFDAYMLLVEGAGKRILYTGDFRRHGRKSVLVDRFMANPPPDIDVLVTEGSNLGTDKPVKSEKEIEQDFVELFNRTTGRVFVSWSGQNIDRTVSLYRAAKRTGRMLAIDLYTADVLDRIAAGTRLPRAGFTNLRVVVTKGLGSYYRKLGRGTLWRIWRYTASPRATLWAAAKSSWCAAPCCVIIRLPALCPRLMTPSISQCGAAIFQNPISRRCWNGAGRVGPRSPIFTPAATPRRMICVPSLQPSDRNGCAGAWREMGRGSAWLWHNSPPCGWRNTGHSLTLAVAPKTVLTSTPPAVGISWR